jgi:hypothetical protein
VAALAPEKDSNAVLRSLVVVLYSVVRSNM